MNENSAGEIKLVDDCLEKKSSGHQSSLRSQSPMDDFYSGHRHRRTLQKKGDHSSQISLRSLSRSKSRQLRLNRSDSNLSDFSQISTHQKAHLSQPLQEADPSSPLNHLVALTAVPTHKDVIEEQDVEETFGEDQMAKASFEEKTETKGETAQPAAEKKHFTMNMLMELQQSSKAQELSKNYEFHYNKQVTNPNLTESWDTTNEKAAASYVNSLFTMFGAPPSVTKKAEEKATIETKPVQIPEPPKVSESWEKTNEKAAQSYVYSLFTMFGTGNAQPQLISQPKNVEQPITKQAKPLIQPKVSESWEKNNEQAATDFISSLFTKIQSEPQPPQTLPKPTLTKQPTVQSSASSHSSFSSSHSFKHTIIPPQLQMKEHQAPIVQQEHTIEQQEVVEMVEVVVDEEFVECEPSSASNSELGEQRKDYAKSSKVEKEAQKQISLKIESAVLSIQIEQQPNKDILQQVVIMQEQPKQSYIMSLDNDSTVSEQLLSKLIEKVVESLIEDKVGTAAYLLTNSMLSKPKEAKHKRTINVKSSSSEDDFSRKSSIKSIKQQHSSIPPSIKPLPAQPDSELEGAISQFLKHEESKRLSVASIKHFEQHRARTDSLFEDALLPSSLQQQHPPMQDSYLDAVLTAIVKEEIKMSSLQVLKEAEHLAAAQATNRLETYLIKEMLITQVVLGQSQVMEQASEEACDMVVKRIIYEMMCVFEVDLTALMAEQAVDRVEEDMIGRLVDFLDPNTSNDDNDNDGINVKRHVKAKKKRVNRNLGETQETRKLEKMLGIKQPKKVKKSPLRMRLDTSKVSVEELLDVQFFEKCFFGKKLQIRDQLIFKIYAEELLELVKKGINKGLNKKIRSNKRSRSPIQYRSANIEPVTVGSPINIVTSHYQPQHIVQEQVVSLNIKPPPVSKQDFYSPEFAQSNKEPGKQKPRLQISDPALNQNKTVSKVEIQYNIEQEQEESEKLSDDMEIPEDFRIPLVKEESQISYVEQSQKRQSLISNLEVRNISPMHHQEPQGQNDEYTSNSQKKKEKQPRNSFSFMVPEISLHSDTGKKQMSQFIININEESSHNNEAFSSSTLNPIGQRSPNTMIQDTMQSPNSQSINESAEQQESLIGTRESPKADLPKRIQRPQIKRDNDYIHAQEQVIQDYGQFQNIEVMPRKVTTAAQQQAKIYKNLEHQVKEILKNRNFTNKPIKIKRQFKNQSERVSPVNSRLVNQDQSNQTRDNEYYPNKYQFQNFIVNNKDQAPQLANNLNFALSNPSLQINQNIQIVQSNTPLLPAYSQYNQNRPQTQAMNKIRDPRARSIQRKRFDLLDQTDFNIQSLQHQYHLAGGILNARSEKSHNFSTLRPSTVNSSPKNHYQTEAPRASSKVKRRLQQALNSSTLQYEKEMFNYLEESKIEKLFVKRNASRSKNRRMMIKQAMTSAVNSPNRSPLNSTTINYRK